jgi:hypothetical protein
MSSLRGLVDVMVVLDALGIDENVTDSTIINILMNNILQSLGTLKLYINEKKSQIRFVTFNRLHNDCYVYSL